VAKRKKRNPWDAVFDQLRVVRPDSWVCAPPATDVELDAVESHLGMPLPPSYREFMKRFGSGELLGWVRLDEITVERRGGFDVVSHTRDVRDYAKMFRDRVPNAAWFTQLVCFGGNGGGDAYCWDPSAKSLAHPHEYPCYNMPHEDEENPVLIGQTFWEFIAWGAPDYRSFQEHEPDEQPPTGITFCPRYIRDKKTPSKQNVKRWLGHSNVRDLALAIRDHGRADAFPALADALQEAGCANADVLDSCRRGDPEIDGVWVLRVLLGEK
jgi:hypothetical protein